MSEDRKNNEKRKQINIWDTVAPIFSKAGHNYWNEFGERLVELSNIKDGGLLLDIGMGRGASLFPAIQKIGNNGKIVGIDSSERMVHETNRELLENNIINTEVYIMDVKNMTFAKETFDYIISGFFISTLFYCEQKLNYISRVLKNGGSFSFTTWGEQNDQKWLTHITDKYISKKSTLTGDRYNTVNSIISVLQESKFKNIRVHEEQPYVIYTNEEQWWNEMNSNAFRCIIDEIKELGKNQIESFKADVNEGLKEFTKEDGIYLKMPVIYAFCEK
ncbi:hypothetical protein SH1V18_19530 [Vallitalea longa]|uniref:Methyltransferase domain-containing protein n=1 Tax=Vallitalea longa TaxID=2936439 RepID=A0A9W5YDZ8_9FIRM|nr:class I SAM-dependent methyltransferase [Vallitalea longa]GKX29473.1 hypothetical protein SH1V18_19530 [Vallitalea longa]